MTTSLSESTNSQILTVWMEQQSWEGVGDVWDLTVFTLPLAPSKNSCWAGWKKFQLTRVCFGIVVIFIYFF